MPPRALALTLLLSACVTEPEARALRDLELGRASAPAWTFVDEAGLLHVRESTDTSLVLRASSAEFAFKLTRTDAALDVVTVRISNVLPGLSLSAPVGVLTADGSPTAGTAEPTLHLGARFDVRFPPGVDVVEVRSVPPATGDFTFLALGDIQEAIPRFGEVVDRLNAEPAADFLVLLGDITNRTSPQEFDDIEAAISRLRMPVYATPGNHDCYTSDGYQRRFGRASYTFTHRGVRFTSLDSGSGTLAATTWDALPSWLAAGRTQPHVVFTHIPITEVNGLRGSQWSSRREARHASSLLAEAGVDLLLFGHVHSFDAFEVAGIPAFISGGGGASPEAFDGLGRHFLRVTVKGGVPSIAVVRVDE